MNSIQNQSYLLLTFQYQSQLSWVYILLQYYYFANLIFWPWGICFSSLPSAKFRNKSKISRELGKFIKFSYIAFLINSLIEIFDWFFLRYRINFNSSLIEIRIFTYGNCLAFVKFWKGLLSFCHCLHSRKILKIFNDFIQ